MEELAAALTEQLRLALRASRTNPDLSLGTAGLQVAVLAALQGGASVGVDAAIAELEALGIGVDWTLVNEAARNWARDYAYSLVNDINETSRRILQQEVSQWVASGEHFDRLKEALADTFGERRARVIAMTETTRAYAEGNIATWKASGMADYAPATKPPAHPNCRCSLSLVEESDGSWQYIWNAANDELMCSVCDDLNQTGVGLAKDAPVD